MTALCTTGILDVFWCLRIAKQESKTFHTYNASSSTFTGKVQLLLYYHCKSRYAVGASGRFGGRSSWVNRHLVLFCYHLYIPFTFFSNHTPSEIPLFLPVNGWISLSLHNKQQWMLLIFMTSSFSHSWNKFLQWVLCSKREGRIHPPCLSSTTRDRQPKHCYPNINMSNYFGSLLQFEYEMLPE